MSYHPRPVNTTSVRLDPDILSLIEHLAVNAHNVWAAQRLLDGWTWGPHRSDPDKKNPNLVPYESLPEEEKEYDRKIVTQTIKVIYAMGYKIIKQS